MAKVKKGGRIILAALILAGIFFAVNQFTGEKGSTDSADSGGGIGSLFSGSDDDKIKVCVVTWGGYAAGQYMNEGFASSEASRFKNEHGIDVEFILMDEFDASRSAFKSGDVDLLWTTADAFPTEIQGLKDVDPKIVFQADWSRGGDALVATKNIHTANDLKGKRVAVAFGTPSHTLLLSILEASGLTPGEIDIVKVESAPKATELFKAGQVDAAIVWSPDDDDCVKAVSGAHVLTSTAQASNLIADVFIARKEYIDENKEKLVKFVEGWMQGAAELNSSDKSVQQNARKKAAGILAHGLKQPIDFCENAIEKVRFTTYGDNRNFFGLNSAYSGATGEELYKTMARKYIDIGYISGDVPPWSSVIDLSIIQALSTKNGGDNIAEGSVKFSAPTRNEETKEAIATKHLTINFPTASSDLTADDKDLIKRSFGSTAQKFASLKIRIAGNTDNVGKKQLNRDLSEKRAKSVAGFLMKEYGFSSDRFIVIGNGDSDALGDNSTESGRAKNRRTDMELIQAD